MPHSNPGSFRAQVSFLRRQFLQDGELPFTNVLTEEAIAQALAALGGWLDRIFSPLVTLWVFVGQVLIDLSQMIARWGLGSDFRR
jgi:hypothetical protein